MGVQEKEGKYTFRELLTIIRWRTREYKLNKYRTVSYYLDYKHYKNNDNYHINIVVTEDVKNVGANTTNAVYILKDITREDLNEYIEVGKEWEVIEELIKESEIYLRKIKTNPRSIEELRAKYDKFETKKRI